MKKRLFRNVLVGVMCFALCFSMAGCSKQDGGEATPPAEGDGQEGQAEGENGGENETAPKYVILDETLAAEEYGIGFRKGDELRDLVNAALKVLKAEGTLEEISNQWFGYDLTTTEADAAALEGMDTQEGRTFILGLDDSFPPMGYRDADNNIVGFDIDVAKAVCEKMGWTLEIQPIDWAANVMELNAGNIDCVWNGMTLTEERLEAMDCSDPYMANKQVVVVKGDSGYTSLADLAGKKLALQTGSSAEDALDGSPDFKDSLGQINTFAENMTCFMDLEQGSSDAVLVDSIVAGWYLTTGNL